MKRIVMTSLAVAALVVMALAADGARNPTFAATGECAGGLGNVCRVERICTQFAYEISWPFKIVQTCVSYVEETYYWELLPTDPALPPGEETPQLPADTDG